MVAAAAVLLPGTQVPGGQLWGGNPAVFMRNLSDADIASLDKVSRVGDGDHVPSVLLYQNILTIILTIVYITYLFLRITLISIIISLYSSKFRIHAY